MSRIVKLTIPDELARRADEQRSEESMQSFTLAALRSAVHGSPVEAELRRELAILHDILRGYIESQAKPVTILAAPVEDKRKGW